MRYLYIFNGCLGAGNLYMGLFTNSNIWMINILIGIYLLLRFVIQYHEGKLS